MAQIKHMLLLVEDSSDDEILTLRAIKNCGVLCTVEVIRRGDLVLGKLLSADHPMPELVLLDFHLPALNGLEVLRQLRKHPATKKLPIVILSGLGSESDLTSCLEEGANSCVHKPDDVSLYLDHVGQIVRYWLTVDRRPGQQLALHE
jgi:CheY-like chemotaxis protein